MKRIIGLLFGSMALFLVLGFHSCNKVSGRYIHRDLSKRLENGYFRYSRGKLVKLNRPLRFYNFFFRNASPSDAGNGMLLHKVGSDNAEYFPDNEEYCDLPAGTEIWLLQFVVWEIPSPDRRTFRDYYLWRIEVPSKPEWGWEMCYFMGYDGQLAPFPWDQDIQLGTGEIFRPTDIERLFPGGVWASHQNIRVN